MPTWIYGQEAHEFIDEVFGNQTGDGLGDFWRARLHAALDDRRQVVIRLSNGDVLVSPTRCTRPNLLILDQKSLE